MLQVVFGNNSAVLGVLVKTSSLVWLTRASGLRASVSQTATGLAGLSTDKSLVSTANAILPRRLQTARGTLTSVTRNWSRRNTSTQAGAATPVSRRNALGNSSHRVTTTAMVHIPLRQLVEITASRLLALPPYLVA